MNGPRLHFVAIAVLWLAVAADAAAQTPPTQQVQITGTAAQERREEVAGKQVVTGAELARHGDSRLSEALRRVPGLSVGGSGANLSLRLDGMSDEQTLVLLNGEPVPRGQVLEALSPGMVERIEIVRGAQVQWSGRGIAGTINIITTRAAGQVQSDAALALGSHFGRPIGQAEWNLGDRRDTTSWRLGVMARAEREHYPVSGQLRFTDGAGQTLSAYRVRVYERNHEEALSFSPQAQGRLPGGAQWRSEALLSASSFVGAGEDDRVVDEGALPRMRDDRLWYSHQRRFARLHLKGSLPWADGGSANASITASHGRRVQDSRLTGHDFQGVQVRDSTVDSTRRDTQLSARLDTQHPLNPAHRLTAGAQLESNRRGEDRVQREHIPSWEPDLVAEQYDTQARSLALFVQDDWLPDKATTVSWGARVETLSTRNRSPGLAAVAHRHQLASPMLNLLWRPDAHTQWKGSLSRAYRLPEPRDLMPRRWTRPENSSVIPDFVGNPELRPESAWTLTAGWSRQLQASENSQLSADLVLKRVDDLILSELLQQGNAFLLRPANQGRAWVGSLQLGAQGEWGRLAGAPLRWQASGSARASRVAALPGPDNRLPDQSPWGLQWQVDHQGAGSAWSVGASGRWQAGYGVQAPSGRHLDFGAARSLDLTLNWQASKDDRWRLSAQGLFRGDAIEHTRTVREAGIDTYDSAIRQAPRWRLQWLRRL